MKYLRYFLLILVLVATAHILAACKQRIEQEPPLLLEDGQGTGPVADNSRCHVCHINFADEVLAVTHARANIGCEKCHGSCDAHCGDEDNITPPDIMYPQANINPFCMGCHPREEINIAVHRGVLPEVAANKTYCTDCHGEHRLSYRTRKWDKQTRKLIRDDKVRMIHKDIPD